MNKKSIHNNAVIRILQALLACGQTMWRVGVLGALMLSIAFIAAFVSAIVNQGTGTFNSAKEIISLVLVIFTVAFILVLAWGRIRILLGRKLVELPVEYASMQYFISKMVYLLNAIGIISLILIPLIVLALFTGVYDKH